MEEDEALIEKILEIARVAHNSPGTILNARHTYPASADKIEDILESLSMARRQEILFKADDLYVSGLN